MKYKALYRETRPEVFDEILGQESIVKILRHQVATDTVSHAYLFTGTRGTGKTTTARILAKAVNCEAPDVSGRPCGKCDACRQIAEGTYVDVIEIDAASNNGVDNIRELRESVNYPPAVGRVKVYIIDEVHMLSTGAFNALLKTLEEPPENVIFILATTNPEKLPQTVLSRCMRLDFKRVPQNVLAQHMKDICSDRGVMIENDALRLLAANADGSVRDSLSILEQCLSSGEQHLTRDLVLDFLGAVSEEFYLKLTDHVMRGDISGAFVLIDSAVSDGKDVKQIMKDWMSHCRNLLIAKCVRDPKDLLNLSTENIALLRQQAAGISLAEIDRAIITLAKAINDARYSTQARILLEVAVVSIASGTEYGEAPEVPARSVMPPDQNPVGPAAQPAAPIHEQNPAGPAPAQSAASGLDQDPSYSASAPEPEIKTYSPEPEPEIEPYAAPDTDSASSATETAPEPDSKTATEPAQNDATAGAGPQVRPQEQPASDISSAGAGPQVRTPGELADIWRDVCQEASANKPLLNILFDCVPIEQKGEEIKLIAGFGMAKEIIERDASYINSLLKRFGAEGHIVCVVDEGGAVGRAAGNSAGRREENWSSRAAGSAAGDLKGGAGSHEDSGRGASASQAEIDAVAADAADLADVYETEESAGAAYGGGENDLEKARREASRLLGIEVKIEE